MQPRFKVLRLIGTVYKILGGLAGILTLLLVLGICATSVIGGAALSGIERELGGRGGGGLLGSTLGGVVVALVTILYGGAVTVSLYGLGEGIYLILALEENTRETVALLSNGIDKVENSDRQEAFEGPS